MSRAATLARLGEAGKGAGARRTSMEEVVKMSLFILMGALQ